MTTPHFPEDNSMATGMGKFGSTNEIDWDVMQRRRDRQRRWIQLSLMAVRDLERLYVKTCGQEPPLQGDGSERSSRRETMVRAILDIELPAK